MKEANVARVSLICKKCKKVFDAEPGQLVENAGKIPCPRCGRTSVYDWQNTKTFSKALKSTD